MILTQETRNGLTKMAAISRIAGSNGARADAEAVKGLDPEIAAAADWIDTLSACDVRTHDLDDGCLYCPGNDGGECSLFEALEWDHAPPMQERLTAAYGEPAPKLCPLRHGGSMLYRGLP